MFFFSSFGFEIVATFYLLFNLSFALKDTQTLTQSIEVKRMVKQSQRITKKTKVIQELIQIFSR